MFSLKKSANSHLAHRLFCIDISPTYSRWSPTTTHQVDWESFDHKHPPYLVQATLQQIINTTWVSVLDLLRPYLWTACRHACMGRILARRVQSLYSNRNQQVRHFAYDVCCMSSIVVGAIRNWRKDWKSRGRSVMSVQHAAAHAAWIKGRRMPIENGRH